ncbi:helix-turn-helix transcriptional regulator [Caldimonas tepidiphila]|uniref:helix-turn-helix transcriptional regulator n=1 Tax=Caldimonas tepidiphila TaxID=2315841 RepID=UPI000E5C2455|nr:helix-turn-helix transcriptional regulator [Caldimonas tepidiphila]
MDTWALQSPGERATQGSLAGVIDAVGRPGFAARALGHLNGALAAGSWSVYRLWHDRPPVLHLSASHGVPDTTSDCFAAYRDRGLYRRDHSFDAVRALPRPGHAVMLRMSASEAPNADHREAIYLRHGVLERLSVARLEADGSLLAVNLYHHAHQGRFGEGELAHFAELAPLLLAGVARHLEWQSGEPPPAPDHRAALRRRCPALTSRELDVLERLLRGMSYDGIAADMGLSVATVKTYRGRAFERLGIHFKSELFASFVATPADAVHLSDDSGATPRRRHSAP